MSEETWNRFAATGSVRDYLDYRACAGKDTATDSLTAREEQTHGADHPAERNGALCNAYRGL